MFGSFQRPIGALADLKELEYIAILHQTCVPKIRTNATISVSDIRYFLRSRYGIVLSKEEGIEIVRGLGGLGGTAANQLNDENLKDGKEEDDIENGLYDKNNENENEKEEEEEKFEDAFDEDGHNEEGEEEGKSDWSNTLKGFQIPMNLANDAIHTATTNIQERTRRVLRRKDTENGNTIELEEFLDLAQLTSVLLIPTILQAAHTLSMENQNQEEEENDAEYQKSNSLPPNLIKDVLRIIMGSKRLEIVQQHQEMISDGATRHLLQTSDEHQQQKQKTTKKKKNDKQTTIQHLPPLRRLALTKDFVRSLLESIAEFEAADDDTLLTEMVNAAGGEGILFDERSFARALVSDITAFASSLEHNNERSTPFYDVFGFDPVDSNTKMKLLLEQQQQQQQQQQYQEDDHFEDNVAKESATMPIISSNTITVDANTKAVETTTTSTTATIPSTNVFAPRDPGPFIMPPPPDGPVQYPKYVWPATYIDYVVDSHYSNLFLSLLWAFYIVSVGTFMTLIGTTDFGNTNCTPSFGCTVLDTVVSWFIFALLLCALAFLLIIPVSLGNDPYLRSWIFTLISTIFLLAYAIIPNSIIVDYTRGIPHSNIAGDLNDTERVVQNDVFRFFLWIYSIFGLCLTVKLLLHFLSVILLSSSSSRIYKQHPAFQFLFFPTSDMIGSTFLKRAGTYKLNGLVNNAHKLHITRAKSGGDTMRNFVINGESMESCGGLIWTWQQIRNGNLFEQEGFLMFTRLLIGQGGQIVGLIFFVIVIIIAATRFGDSVQTIRADIIAQQRLSSSSSSSIDKEKVQELFETFSNIIPERWVINASFTVGLICAIIIGLLLILLYIPSTVSTVLKLRCGIIPTIRDSTNFSSSFRVSTDAINYNIANAIYALLGSVSLFFVIFGGIVFLCLWPITRNIAEYIIALCIGISITMGVKIGLMMWCRSKLILAFYRKNPRWANIYSLAFECWNIGLGAGILLSRLTQLLLAAAFWIGRIDSTFLDSNVTLMGYEFDYAPINYRKEILTHEAHRHPFLERLGMMYLMKYKYGHRFSSDAGVWWRLLFVTSLMPWLLKYRDIRDDNNDDDNDDNNKEKEKKEEEDDDDEFNNETAAELARVSEDQRRLRNRLAARLSVARHRVSAKRRLVVAASSEEEEGGAHKKKDE